MRSKLVLPNFDGIKKLFLKRSAENTEILRALDITQDKVFGVIHLSRKSFKLYIF